MNRKRIRIFNRFWLPIAFMTLLIFILATLLLVQRNNLYSLQQRIDSVQIDQAQKIAPKERIELEKQRIELENSTYGTLIQALGGAFFFVTAYISWLSYRSTEEKQITERFTKAVEQLDRNKAVAERLGGIYSLERIAEDSPKDHWTIIEVLTSWIREQSCSSQNQNTIDELPIDLQAALTVIGRRNFGNDPENKKIDLRNTCLHGVILGRSNLPEVKFSESNLYRARLWKSNLYKADFSINYDKLALSFYYADFYDFGIKVKQEVREGKLRGANLAEADFGKAYLDRANFDGAILKKANLTGASLVKASLILSDLTDAVLNDADLTDSNLIECNFNKAAFKRAKLIRANLIGADLSKANLSGTVLTHALYSKDTKFPDGFDLARHSMRSINPASDLQNAKLSGADLRDCNLSQANLVNADLQKADLSGVNLAEADLSGANLSQARLYKANLTDTKLSGAVLRWAIMPDGSIHD